MELTIILNFGLETWRVAEAMAPYLLFGFLAAGLLRVFVSPEWLRRHMGGSGVTPVIKAVLFGAPLPLCSCGVLAVTASLRRQGAGRAAATGFLLSTPQTGVDSIIATWGTLGPLMAVTRPLLAVLSGMVGGLLVSRYGEQDNPVKEEETGRSCRVGTSEGSCCERTPASSETGGNGEHGEGYDRDQPLIRRLANGLRYGLITLPADIARPLVLGILAAGLISAMVPPNTLAPWIGGGPVAMLVMIAVGIPIYVCATASIPLALSFIHLGASPGAALAFLVAGPATNAATLAVLWSMMGRRTTLLFLLTVALTALLGGMAYDALATVAPEMLVPQGGHVHHHEEMEGGSWLFVALLALSLVAGKIESGIRRVFAPPVSLPDSVSRSSGLPAKEDEEEADVTLTIENMTCAHCVASVQRIVRDSLPDVTPEIDLGSRRVVLRRSGPRAAAVIERLRAAGFVVEPVSR
ncbi:MAG TPA: SO_0444 family Cu/Zn efflux transporter [Candidatus Hydrogenedentes bacterium]|nr:SO_0444 family Cu/Zn efflux transporter [Candidatus Hydrogenedentota bacterium]